MAYPKEEREKNKSLLLATLNYLLEYHSADLVFDDYSPSRELYKDELRKTELDIQKYRSQQIKKRLDRHTALLKHALTYVNISLGGGTGGIYGAKGERLPIKAYWKDDHHVIIETKKEYETVFSYSQVSSYGELIKIEYF